MIETEVISVDMGRRVLCDSCAKDFTDSEESGGLQFQSKAIGPCCAARYFENAKRYGEERFIRGICPDGMSFADWVRDELRRIEP